MRKNLIKPLDLCDFIDTYNPLLLRNEKSGKFEFYENISKCYYEFCERTILFSLSGYFDPVLLLIKFYEIFEYEAKREVKVWEKSFGVEYGGGILIDWSSKLDRDYYLKAIVRGVCHFLDCPYKANMMKLALSEIDERYDKLLKKTHEL